EASSSFVAGRLALNPATGLAVALVRKLRLLFWSAVGLVFLARRPARAAVPAAARASLVLPGLILFALLASSAGAAAQEAPAVVAGSVSIASPDGAPVLVPGVTVTLDCGGGEPRTEISDQQGDFRFAAVTAATGACSIVAELEGFKSTTT